MRARRPGAPAYLVLGLIALLAAGCRNSTRDVVAEVEQAADSADQLMIGLRQVMTHEGIRQAYLEADSAFIYETSGRVELKDIRVTFFTVTGVETSVLTAKEGAYNLRSGQMEARRECVVVMTSGARLTSSVLRYDQTKNEVSTDQPFVYDATDRHIEGEGFVSDPAFTSIRTLRPRGTAGRFVLPGQ